MSYSLAPQQVTLSCEGQYHFSCSLHFVLPPQHVCLVCSPNCCTEPVVPQWAAVWRSILCSSWTMMSGWTWVTLWVNECPGAAERWVSEALRGAGRPASDRGGPADIWQGSAAVPPRGSADCLLRTGGLWYVAALWEGLWLTARSAHSFTWSWQTNGYRRLQASSLHVHIRSCRSRGQDFIIQVVFCHLSSRMWCLRWKSAFERFLWLITSMLLSTATQESPGGFNDTMSVCYIMASWPGLGSLAKYLNSLNDSIANESVIKSVICLSLLANITGSRLYQM